MNRWERTAAAAWKIIKRKGERWCPRESLLPVTGKVGLNKNIHRFQLAIFRARKPHRKAPQA